jgi:hypothetical protein
MLIGVSSKTIGDEMAGPQKAPRPDDTGPVLPQNGTARRKSKKDYG